MLNLDNLRRCVFEAKKRKGMCSSMREKKLTIRGQCYEPIIEFLWDERKHLVIVLTKYKVCYAEKITINGQYISGHFYD